MCPRVDVNTKKERWEITYTCSSISIDMTSGAIPGMAMMVVPRPVGQPGTPMVGIYYSYWTGNKVIAR